jgi:hypothetical protein
LHLPIAEIYVAYLNVRVVMNSHTIYYNKIGVILRVLPRTILLLGGIYEISISRFLSVVTMIVLIGYQILTNLEAFKSNDDRFTNNHLIYSIIIMLVGVIAFVFKDHQ